MSKEEVNIPASWEMVEFGELLDYIQPTNYIVNSTNYNDNYKIPVLTPGKSFIKGYTNEEKGIFSDLPAIIFDDFTTASRFVNFPFKVKSSAMKILVPSTDLINFKFLFYALQMTEIRNDTHKRYWISVFAKKKFPLPPLNEQNRIISKIEELFSDLDNGIANLKIAQKQLKVYRQALLKNAFEGKLTEQWRKDNNPEPAEKLLERIKEERHKRYEQDLADWKEAVKQWEKDGKNGKKPGKPRLYLFIPDVNIKHKKLSKIPNKWLACKLGEVFEVFVGSTPSRKKTEYWNNGNIPWISSGEVHFNTIYATKEKITHDGLTNASTTLHPIGTVMLGMIGEGKTRGQAAILKVKACHNQNTAAIRVSDIGFNPEFLYYNLELNYERNRDFGSGNSQKALNRRIIQHFNFPLCSVEEQDKIAEIIDDQFSIIHHLQQTIESSLKKSEALRQSILKKAFEGKLVPQDPEDEPASELLKRIKVEKEKYLAEQKELKKKAPKRKNKK